MAKQLKIKDWLNDFLASRELDAPDGRHLFSYHATPDEFLTLEEGLKQNMTLASMPLCAGSKGTEGRHGRMTSS